MRQAGNAWELTLIQPGFALRWTLRSAFPWLWCGAEYTDLYTGRTDTIEVKGLALRTQAPGVFPEFEGGTERWALRAGRLKDGRLRVTARVSDRMGRQMLLDAELIQLFPEDQTVYRVSARADWQGRECLFPSASSVGEWLRQEEGTTAPRRFGCAGQDTGMTCAFWRRGQASFSRPAVSEEKWMLTPLGETGRDDPEGQKQTPAVRYGRWSHLALRAQLLGYERE